MVMILTLWVVEVMRLLIVIRLLHMEEWTFVIQTLVLQNGREHTILLEVTNMEKEVFDGETLIIHRVGLPYTLPDLFLVDYLYIL